MQMYCCKATRTTNIKLYIHYVFPYFEFVYNLFNGVTIQIIQVRKSRWQGIINYDNKVVVAWFKVLH